MIGPTWFLIILAICIGFFVVSGTLNSIIPQDTSKELFDGCLFPVFILAILSTLATCAG